MICNRIAAPLVAVAVALGAGCAEDVPTLNLRTTAQSAIAVAPPGDAIPSIDGHYRWVLAESPDGATVADLAAETAASIEFTPPLRGTYGIDRWFVGGAAEQLSYHVVLEALGLPPVASVGGANSASLGVATMFDGSASTSAEHLALAFRWRLASRPEGSAAELTDSTTTLASLVPDAVGAYAIELRVFDGDLWSAPAVFTVAAH